MTCRTLPRRNNVQINGNILNEYEEDKGKILLEVASQAAIEVIVEAKKWNKFKLEYPEMRTISLSGVLKKQIRDQKVSYFVNVNSIGCFYKLFEDELKTSFYGKVKLKKKFDFNTGSSMYLKRMVFETIGSGSPIIFEAIALRSIAPHFDEIEEGAEFTLRAIYISNNDDHAPYWKITHSPQF